MTPGESAGNARGIEPGRDRADHARWRADRDFLKANREALTAAAARLYSEPGDSPPLLTRGAWTPTRPVPLGEIELGWVDSPVPAAVTGTEPEAANALPVTASGERLAQSSSYSAAIRALDPPRLFENRPAYRLVGARLGSDGVARGAGAMAFAAGAYFDGVDVGEAAAHELAAVARSGGEISLESLPFRRLIGDPTDPARRSMPVAITTLTIRYDRSRRDARFLAHWRDPAKVAANGGMYTVVPVGVFQPAGRAVDDGVGDFDLWRSVAREYGEELLGDEEHVDVDYGTWPLFRALRRARDAGECRPYCLGIGVDPLTLAVDILVAAVFEARAFDGIFTDLVAENDEGRVITSWDDGGFGVPFAEAAIGRVVGAERTQPAGAAVLRRAWLARHDLLAE